MGRRPGWRWTGRRGKAQQQQQPQPARRRPGRPASSMTRMTRHSVSAEDGVSESLGPWSIRLVGIATEFNSLGAQPSGWQ